MSDTVPPFILTGAPAPPVIVPPAIITVPVVVTRLMALAAPEVVTLPILTLTVVAPEDAMAVLLPVLMSNPSTFTLLAKVTVHDKVGFVPAGIVSAPTVNALPAPLSVCPDFNTVFPVVLPDPVCTYMI